MKNFGASPDEWTYFDVILGLTEDLLPVVSDPTAKISDKSKIKTAGKTPSIFNKNHEVIGFNGWTSHSASAHDVESWSDQGYGICVQTRRIRAIDVDVVDPVLAKKIDDFIFNFLNIKLPRRTRSNSSKFLLMFELTGEFSKQVIRIDDHNIIEFLANGQQFIAVGTHTSGCKYEWENGLPGCIPALNEAQFIKLWSALALKFNGEIITSKPTKNRDLSNNYECKNDSVTDFLDKNWPVFFVGKFGERYIECPFADEHTTESNETATAYFPAGTGGFERGHFRCLHAHCANKDDSDFLNAIDYVKSDFEVINVSPQDVAMPGFLRDKFGKIEATINNVYLAVKRSDLCNIEIRFDQFRDEIMLTQTGKNDWITFTDGDYIRLRIGLEKFGFKQISRELMRDVVMLAAEENHFDSAENWLNGLQWDGVERVRTFLSDYFNAEKNDYTESVSLYLWTALAGRVLSPGIKADMVPILVGPQGCGKSTGVSALSPHTDYFTEISFAEKDDDLARKMRGRLVCEIGELRGLHTKELESIKAFITRTHENWVPKYREFATQFPRRLVFVGTTNQAEFLADDTGNRRFLPVDVKDIDVAGISLMRDLLWAEAKHIFKKTGVQYKVAEQLATREHTKYMIKDVWLETVAKWLENTDVFTNDRPTDRPFLKLVDVLRDAIGLETKQIGRREELRMSKTLQMLNYKKTVKKVDGKSARVFVKDALV